MSKKDRLEEAYRRLRAQETPDLWDRIESGLDRGTEECRKNIHVEEALPARSPAPWHRLGLAAAAVCILAFAGTRFGRMPEESGWRSAETAAGTGETFAAETTAGERPAEEAPEESHSAETAARARESRSEKTTAEAGETRAEATGWPGGDTAEFVWYGGLELSGTETALPAVNAVYVPADSAYFTEEILKETDLLCRGSVEAVSYETDENGWICSVIYDLIIDKILYSEDYVAEKQKIQVRSPLVGNADQAEALYRMKEGGRYVLPLMHSEGSRWLLAYPYAPQIEVTEADQYVFHTGWRSLVDDRTVAVRKPSAESADDFYFDRMVLRDDEAFLSNLTALTEAMKQGRRSS